MQPVIPYRPPLLWVHGMIRDLLVQIKRVHVLSSIPLDQLIQLISTGVQTSLLERALGHCEEEQLRPAI